MSIPELPPKRRIATAQAKNVTIDGDMKVLLNPYYDFPRAPITPSVLPQPYVPPSYRKQMGKMIKTRTAMDLKNETDSFNTNIKDTNYGGHMTRDSNVPSSDLRTAGI